MHPNANNRMPVHPPKDTHTYLSSPLPTHPIQSGPIELSECLTERIGLLTGKAADAFLTLPAIMVFVVRPE